jgi:hypothetical protein
MRRERSVLFLHVGSEKPECAPAAPKKNSASKRDSMSLSSSRMNHYEQGVHEPDFTMILRLAKALGISAAFFFCEDDRLAEQIWTLSASSKTNAR